MAMSDDRHFVWSCRCPEHRGTGAGGRAIPSDIGSRPRPLDVRGTQATALEYCSVMYVVWAASRFTHSLIHSLSKSIQ